MEISKYIKLLKGFEELENELIRLRKIEKKIPTVRLVVDYMACSYPERGPSIYFDYDSSNKVLNYIIKTFEEYGYVSKIEVDRIKKENKELLEYKERLGLFDKIKRLFVNKS